MVVIDEYTGIVCDNDERMRIFVDYVKEYRDNITDNDFICIDFEFYRHNIALMQINFDKDKKMFIIKPPLLKDKIKHVIDLLVDDRIYKILHGADSLDIPYIIKLIGDKERVKMFMSRYIDTRYICEYYKVNIESDHRCSIYDALLYFDVIDKRLYDKLVIDNKKMGPIHKINWEITKLTPLHVMYAFYDVIYLKKLLINVLKKAHISTDLIDTYKYIDVIARYVTLEKKNVTDVTDYINKIINPISNHRIIVNNRSYTLSEIYDAIIDNMKVVRKGKIIDIRSLLGVHFFKSNMVAIFKFIIYSHIARKYRIMASKKRTVNVRIRIQSIYDRITAIGYSRMIPLLREFCNEAASKISHLF